MSDSEIVAANQKLYISESGKNLQPSFLPGEIRFLYLWVHPAWTEFNDEDLRANTQFIDALAKSPRAALIQVPWGYGNHAGVGIWKSPGHLWDSIRKLLVLNLTAREKLGQRFQLWSNKSKFIQGDDKNATDLLQKVFNLAPNMDNEYFETFDPYKNHYREEPRLLTRIIVYGKECDSCALFQAGGTKLGTIAHSVRHIYSETPLEALPYTESYADPMNHLPNWNRVGLGTFYGPSSCSSRLSNLLKKP